MYLLTIKLKQLKCVSEYWCFTSHHSQDYYTLINGVSSRIGNENADIENVKLKGFYNTRIYPILKPRQLESL